MKVWKCYLAMAILLAPFTLIGCNSSTEIVEGPPATYIESSWTMPFEACLWIETEDTDRYCEGEFWETFPQHLQYCDETIYYYEEDGKVAICAPPTCNLSPRQQHILYMYASGTEAEASDGS